MRVVSVVLISLFFSRPSFAQIADSSFFPSVRSLNPGLAHLREQALVSFDASQTQVKKNHAVTAGGIVGGIDTTVDLQKTTLFGAGKYGFVGLELLGDRETGKKVEFINSTTHGARTISSDATSNYFGGILDLTILGVGFASAKYDTFYQFRVGDPPSISAHDTLTANEYQVLKVGTAFKIKDFTFGAYGVQKKSTENYEYTYYDPTTGNKGSTEKTPATRTQTGYGVGFGYSTKMYRIELSTEQMGKGSLDVDSDPAQIVQESTASSRTGVAVEARYGKLSLGARVKNNVGNFTDLENLISSNMLYGQMGESDTRMETSFNFGWGADKGLSYSAFYTRSETTVDEPSPVFTTDAYPATTTSSAFGVNLSYYF